MAGLPADRGIDPDLETCPADLAAAAVLVFAPFIGHPPRTGARRMGPKQRNRRVRYSANVASVLWPVGLRQCGAIAGSDRPTRGRAPARAPRW